MRKLSINQKTLPVSYYVGIANKNPKTKLIGFCLDQSNHFMGVHRIFHSLERKVVPVTKNKNQLG